MSILLGNGDGTFGATRYYASGGRPRHLAVGDFNGDGHLDLAMTDGFTVTIYLGKGDGTFEVPVLYAANGGPVAVAVGDFNGDGIPDLAVANGGDPGSVSILLGKGDGTFQAARSYGTALPLYVQTIAAGDFNGDGIPDLVVTALQTGWVNIFLGNGDGSFQAPQSVAAFGSPVVVADVNSDGVLDLLLLSPSPAGGEAGVISVLLGNGDGTFQQPLTFPAGNGPTSLAVGDFNSDGILDIVTSNFAVVGTPRHPKIIENGLRVLLGNGDGTFGAPQAYAIQPGDSRPGRVVVGDFNGDGFPDLAVVSANADSSQLNIWLNKGDGSFGAALNHSLSMALSPLAVGDFNGDGHLDLAITSQRSFADPGKVSILLGKGDGTFAAAPSYVVGFHPEFMVVADFNSDGIADLAVADSSGVSLLLGNGDGTFQARQSYAAGSGGMLVVADFNGDGWPDLALSASATILLNER